MLSEFIKNYVLVFAWLNVFEDVFHGSWDNTSFIIMHIVTEALHRVSFPRSSLTIGKYGGIVAFKSAANW